MNPKPRNAKTIARRKASETKLKLKPSEKLACKNLKLDHDILDGIKRGVRRFGWLKPRKEALAREEGK